MTGRPADDEGSVLVMALAFLSLFGLAIAAVLGFAETGFKAANAVHVAAGKHYAADAAVEGAINAIRAVPSVGKEGNTPACFTLPAGAVNAASAVTVDCTGRAGSGAAGAAAGGTLPVNAVLTLPTNVTEGVVQTAASALTVAGNVATNRARTSPAGSALTVQGTLTCRTASGTGTVTASTTSCPAPVAPALTDPVYAPAITSAPAAVTAPACPAGATATFLPGTYQSAAALTTLMSGACASKTFHFTPGTYYFMFTDAGTHEWRVNDATASLIGGALTASAFPSRCDLAQAGVQFVFGGDSRLAVASGSLELCPPLSAGQRIAIHGVAVTTASTPATATTAGPATATNTSAYLFAPATSAVATDGSFASTSITDNKGVATIALGGFSSTLVPANATVTAASLEVTHRYTGDNGKVALDVTAGDASLTSSPTNLLCPTLGVTCTSTFNVPLAALGTPARANGIAVTYRAEDGPGQADMVPAVDGVVFRVTYTMPGLTASSGCALVAPYSPATGTTCAVLKATGGATTRVAVKGTIYAPLAPVDLSMTGQLNIVAQRGILARTLYAGLAPAASYTGALIALGAGTNDRVVLFTAVIAGAPVLRAEATFDDGNGATPGAAVTVGAWSVLN